MTAADVVTRVRRLIGEVPGDDEDVWDDAAVAGSPTTDVSDRAIVRMVSEAQKSVVLRVKAAAMPTALARYTGPFPGAPTRAVRPVVGGVFRVAGAVAGAGVPYDPSGFVEGTSNAGDRVYAFVSSRYARFTSVGAGASSTTGVPEAVFFGPGGSEVARVAVGATAAIGTPLDVVPTDVVTVELQGGTATGLHVWMVGTTATDDTNGDSGADGFPATFRTPAAHRRMEASGRNATAPFPVFTWASGRLAIHPTPDSAAAYFVVLPPDIDPDTQSAATMVLPDRFAPALAFDVASRLFIDRGDAESATACQSLYAAELAPFALGTRLDDGFPDSDSLAEGG